MSTAANLVWILDRTVVPMLREEWLAVTRSAGGMVLTEVHRVQRIDGQVNRVSASESR